MKKPKKSFQIYKKLSIYSIFILSILFTLSILAGVINNPFTKKVEADSVPYLVKDIYTGAGGSNLEQITVIGNTLYFAAIDSTNGMELWKSDGTEAGTTMIKDIEIGSLGSFPYNLTSLGNTLYFSTGDPINGYQLWKSDGTEAGTVMVSQPGFWFDRLYETLPLGDTLFFTAEESIHGPELWKSDGTPSGTDIVKDIVTGAGGSYPVYLATLGDTLYFFAAIMDSPPPPPPEIQLWKSDGTEVQTEMVKNIGNESPMCMPSDLTQVGDTLFFGTEMGVNGTELWKSDGTEAGTNLVKIIDPDGFSGAPKYFQALGGTVFFAASDLWKSDGTEAGTEMVKAINLDFEMLYETTHTNSIVVMGDTLFFAADDGINGVELWKSDGTEAGTVMVKDINPGGPYSPTDSFPEYLTVVGNTLYFAADDGTNGIELWKSDGTEDGTVLVDDIYTGSESSEPNYLTLLDDTLYFSASNSVYGKELWALDVAGDLVEQKIEIYSLEDLNAVRNDLSASYILMNDLDFNDLADYETYDSGTGWEGDDLQTQWTTGTGWTPIGDSVTPFTGILDGGEYEISNLYINNPSGEELGLIGRLDSSGEIKNLGLLNIDLIGSYYIGGVIGQIPYGGGGTITNVYTTGSITDTDGSVGGIIGQCDSTTITDSYSTVTISGGSYDVGGLVGYMTQTTLSNSHYSGVISPSVADPYSGDIGGLVGLADYLSLITDSYSTGSITGYAGVGGLVGWCEDTIIRDSYSTATVTGYESVGGLVGEYRVGSETSIIEDSYATGDITGYDPDGYSSLEIGGLVGYNYRSTIRRSFATGNVTGDDSVGGLVGDSREGIISNSYATGEVSEQVGYYEDGYYIGGFVGYSRGDEINNCYSTGEVTAFAPDDVGGFMGRNYSTSSLVTNSFWDTETSGMTTSTEGEGKTTAQMKNIPTFNDTATEGLDVAWDISLMTSFNPLVPSIWYIDNGNDYPKLSYQYIAPEDPPAEEDIDPEVTTSPATDVTTTSAKLNANLSNLGTYDSVYVHFRYRTSGSGVWVESSQVAKTTTGSYSLELANLTPDTKYEYSAIVSFGESEYVYGNILSFTTNAVVIDPPEEPPVEEPPEEEEEEEEETTEPIKDCTNADESINVNVGDTFKVSISYGSGSPYRPYAPIYDSEILELLEQEDIGYEQPSSPNDVISRVTIGGAVQRVYTFEVKDMATESCTLVKLGLSHAHDGDDKTDEKTIAIFINDDITDETPPDDEADVEESPTTPDEDNGENIFKKVDRIIRDLIDKAVKTISTVNINRETAQTVGTIGYTAATATYVTLNFITFTGTNSISTLQVLSTFFMVGALKKKKKQKYGIVYDSVTKEPINMATVRVFDSSDKLVTTLVTDVYGIFDLNLDQGKYRLEVVSRDHTFPSKAVLGMNDEPYQNIYKGGLINHTPNQPLNISIPMDKENKGFIAKTLASSRSVFLGVLNILLKLLFIVGFAMTIISLIKEPTTLSWVLLTLYILSILILIYLRMKESRSYGTVTTLDGTPVEGVEIGLRELEFDTLYGKRVSNENGKYRFILPKGKYRLESLNDSYVFVGLEKDTFEVGEGMLYILSEDLIVKRVE